MKSRNLFLGILVILIGVVALLSTLGVITFHWSILWRLWPLILVIIGIGLLPLNDYLKAALLLLAIGTGCVLYHMESKHYAEPVKCTERPVSPEQHFSEPYRELEHASLDIEAGACELELEAPCVELAKADIVSNFVNYSLRTEHGESEASLYLTGRSHTKGFLGRTANEVKFALNPQPVWDLRIDMGAAEAELDCSPYRMGNIVINGGACDIDLKLGDSGCDSRVEISTGAADIDIEVPQGVDCEIQLESALIDKDFEGFEKAEPRIWRTPDFGQGDHCITIQLSCAVSDISVKRY